MAPKKPVLSCQNLCLKALQIASKNYIQNATKTLSNSKSGLLELELENSIKSVQFYLFHSTPTCLCSRITQSFLMSLQDWLQQNMHNLHGAACSFKLFRNLYHCVKEILTFLSELVRFSRSIQVTWDNLGEFGSTQD